MQGIEMQGIPSRTLQRSGVEAERSSRVTGTQHSEMQRKRTWKAAQEEEGAGEAAGGMFHGTG